MTTFWRLTTVCALFVLVATGTYTPSSAFDPAEDLTSTADPPTPSATTKPPDPRIGMMTPGLRRRENEKIKEKLKKEKELEENPVPTGPVTSYEDEEDQDSTTALIEGQANLDVSIVVPHMKKSYSSLTAFPWPVAPPRVKAFPPPLPETEKAIKQLLLSSGYTNRISADTPYPTGGWRFVAAMRTAVRKSGMAMPHTIFEHYGWTNGMMNYIIPEITASNNMEEMRFDAFKKVAKENLENEQRIRNEALRQGLEPAILKPKDEPAKSVGKHYEATVKPSKWWVVGVHKAPGLKYYWHHPVEVAEGKLNRVVLTESNAIYIEGSW